MQLANFNKQNAPDDTTMIIYRGRKPIPSERKRDLARRCGVNCIRLRWNESLNTITGVSGFQNVRLRVSPKKGGKGSEPTAQWHKNPHTGEPAREGQADFVPDEMGTGWCYLPDSPTNRVTLAYAEIGKNALWEIDEDGVKKEIVELAAEIKQSIQYQNEMLEAEQRRTEVEMRVREHNATTGVERKNKIELENEVLKKKIKELEAAKEREELKKRLAALQGKIGDTQPKQVDVKDAPKDKQAIRKQAKADVYFANKELVDQVKAAQKEATGNTRGWAFSKEYAEKIKPLISKRIKELKGRDEHSTVGVAA